MSILDLLVDGGRAAQPAWKTAMRAAQHSRGGDLLDLLTFLGLSSAVGGGAGAMIGGSAERGKPGGSYEEGAMGGGEAGAMVGPLMSSALAADIASTRIPLLSSMAVTPSVLAIQEGSSHRRREREEAMAQADRMRAAAMFQNWQHKAMKAAPYP